MKKFLSVIMIFLACFGFTAKLMQLDKFYGTELVAKGCSEADEDGEKEKKDKEANEQIVFHTEIGFIAFALIATQNYHQSSFSKGYVSSPYNPPDFL
ncbi:hypothetical protein OCK74_23200 [Chitinophagaceae bacterium LB-8]|uniref:Uncharacterized protein n=1 Tax=Paraflavisolibacter caeni TaxID=2982496 RepID=A0A9X2Y0D6_9BACT|nr:hypothetical protein [Paraflavisolibacter caeni]MCU7552047.1 hypothetical protein [Paraflavisolibacter caeni]